MGKKHMILAALAPVFRSSTLRRAIVIGLVTALAVIAGPASAAPPCFWIGTEPFCGNNRCPSGYVASQFSRACLYTGRKVHCCPRQGSNDKWDRRVTIVNGTSVVVSRLHASNISRKNWGQDILGKGVLRPGKAFLANIDDGTGACLFDFRAVLANGRAVEQRRVNVCQIRSWTVR
jgi:hypothetical protein